MHTYIHIFSCGLRGRGKEEPGGTTVPHNVSVDDWFANVD